MFVRQPIICLFLLALVGLSAAAPAQFHDINDKVGIARDRADLLEIARVYNLPPDEQKRELPHIYKDIWIRRPVESGAAGANAELMREDKRVTLLSPEAFVKEVEGPDGNSLQNSAYRVCRNLLGPHTSELAPQIIESLHSPDPPERFAAVMLIEQSWRFPQLGQLQPLPYDVGGLAMNVEQRNEVRKSPLQVFLKPLYDLWMKDLDDQYVTLAVCRFQSPRVRDFLIETVVSGKDRYQYTNYLSRIIANEPPPARLLTALSSPEVHIRRAAAESFYQSGSPVLAPYITQLSKDTDSKVRISASFIAFKLPPADWGKVRLSILALMSDPDVEVRGKVTAFLVDREGKRLAPAVLKLIADDSLPQLAHMYIYSAMVKVGGSDFGYQEDFRRDNWRPSTPANRAAIAKFAEWVKANVGE